MADNTNPATSTEEARAQSAATLREQEQMKPVPSQEDADRIKLGEQVNADAEQPTGPAAEAAAETDDANAEAQRKLAGASEPATYATRAAKAK